MQQIYSLIKALYSPYKKTECKKVIKLSIKGISVIYITILIPVFFYLCNFKSLSDNKLN